MKKIFFDILAHFDEKSEKIRKYEMQNRYFEIFFENMDGNFRNFSFFKGFFFENMDFENKKFRFSSKNIFEMCRKCQAIAAPALTASLPCVLPIVSGVPAAREKLRRM